MMIKNIIFDLGNVLIDFKPKDYLKRINIPEKDIEILTKLIFKDRRWTEFDRGTITIDKYVNDLKKENPQYSYFLDLIFNKNWIANFFIPKEKTIEFLKNVSKKYNIYILSNISESVLDYVKTLDFFKYVKSGTYSYKVKACKPEPEIYETFLKVHKLNPKECLFLDDLPQNIYTAKEFGINGIIFDFDETTNISNVISFLEGKEI